MAYPPNFLWAEKDPFKDRDQILPQKEVQDLRRQLADLTAAGIIQAHNTIPKPAPGTRINKMVKFCMDHYWFTRQKIPKYYSDEKIEQALNRLAGNGFFTVLGLVTDLGQVPMYPGERSRPYTIKPVGFYETERMQPGYCDMLATYQRLMERIFRDQNMAELLVFLDYIIIFGTTFDEHHARLERVFRRLAAENFKVSTSKCSLCRTSFEYFGHRVSGEGVAVAPEKVEAVTAWPEAKTVTELKSFLEFCGFYQHFYQDFAALSEPLTRLLREVEAARREDEEAGQWENEEAGRQEGKEVWPKHPWWTRESIEGRWTKECSEAYRSLRNRIINAPVLDRVSMSQRHGYQ